MKEPAYWGVDVGLDSTVIAAVREGERVHFGRPRPEPRRPISVRLESLAWQTEAVAASMAETWPPMCVVVERPTGKFIVPHLYYAASAVMIGLERGLRDRFAHPVSIFQVAVSEWKKATVGKGNATKEDVMRWAVEHGGGPLLSQDEADALAIATYAQGAVR